VKAARVLSQVYGDLGKVVAECSNVRGIRIWGQAIELGVSIVGKEPESARTLESALVTVDFTSSSLDMVLGRVYAPQRIDIPE
jgi:hypothetical protein